MEILASEFSIACFKPEVCARKRSLITKEVGPSAPQLTFNPDDRCSIASTCLLLLATKLWCVLIAVTFVLIRKDIFHLFARNWILFLDPVVALEEVSLIDLLSGSENMKRERNMIVC